MTTPEELARFNSAVARARYDYALHPSEFNARRYCSKCAADAGTGTSCETCAKTRASQVARAERKDA